MMSDYQYFLLLTPFPVYHGSLIVYRLVWAVSSGDDSCQLHFLDFWQKYDFLCCTDSYVSRTYKLSARVMIDDACQLHFSKSCILYVILIFTWNVSTRFQLR